MKGTMTNPMRIGITGLLAVIAVLAGMVHIERTPPVWWDEGWTLAVARNWTEMGHYGLLQVGMPAPPTMAGQIPVVASVALSFKTFGIGIWQGRLPGLVYTVFSLMLLYFVTSKIYSRKVAMLAIALVLFLPVKWGLHPLYEGRQVLGEVPCVFFLLAGYACFLVSERRRLIFLPMAFLSWGLALMTKEQLAPFLTMSFVLPAAFFALKRHWRNAGMMVIALVGSFGARYLFEILKRAILDGHTVSGEHLSGLVQSVAVVLTPSVRISTLVFAFVFGLPTIIGLAFQARKVLLDPDKGQFALMTDAVRLMLWGLVASWFGWFVMLSVGWERYAFPSVFLSAPFIAAVLYEWTSGLNLRQLVDACLRVVKSRKLAMEARPYVGAAVVFMLMVFLSSEALYHFSISPSDTSAAETAHFINQNAKPGSVIETYDSELLFLLMRPYHFPPPQMDVEYIRRTWLHEKSGFVYQPLVADPEYLIVGPFGRDVRLYDAVISSGAVRPLRTIGLYSIYERVR